MEFCKNKKVFVVLNEDGYIADSSECCGVCDSLEEANNAIEYLKFDCDLEDEEFTVVEATMTLQTNSSTECVRTSKDILRNIQSKVKNKSIFS